MSLAPDDMRALWVSLRLACATVVGLLLLGTPLAWWLSRTRSRLRPLAEVLVTLPLVLPPSVLGFYLLLLLGARSPLQGLWSLIGIQAPAFSFAGLVVGSMVYSLPFVVQPLQSAFGALDPRLLEAAATLGAGPWDRFWAVAVPNARHGFLSAIVLGFAHTLGEFGVVLMIGGNIEGATRVASIAIYGHVEAMQYAQAHQLSLLLVALSLGLMTPVYFWRRGRSRALE